MREFRSLLRGLSQFDQGSFPKSSELPIEAAFFRDHRHAFKANTVQKVMLSPKIIWEKLDGNTYTLDREGTSRMKCDGKK